jgi:SAM-dependent methyltransferase
MFGTRLTRLADADRARGDLARRLAKLDRLFPLQDIVEERLDAERVRAYYRECHGAFRKHHSAEGAVHMALNEGGRFDPDGFAEHLRRIETRWAVEAPRAVLEIGFGQGYNLCWFAQRHRDLRFEGIDLTPEHLAIAQARVAQAGLDHVTLRLADMHDLPQADSSIDEAFAIEAFCHAADVPRALSELFRVLHPGGRLSLFDGYQFKPLAALDAQAALTVQLVARGTAVERWQVIDELLIQARGAGFEIEAMYDLDRAVLPNLRRLERLISAVIRFPWLARRALARRAPARGRNVISGYLLRPAVVAGLLGYREIVLRKAGAGPVERQDAAQLLPSDSS